MSGEIEVGYVPLDVHRPFHASSARYKCAIGGWGSGKSSCLCAEAIMFALEQPGSDMILARKYAPSLKDSTEAVFFQMLPSELEKAGKVVRLGGHVASYEFPNGSLLKFKGIDDWHKERSQNICWLGFDEADEQAEATVVGMASRLRQTRPLKVAAERGYETKLPMRRQVCLATNPDGKNWIWRRFINTATEGPYANTRWPNAEGFISTTLDNPHLPIDFVNDQMSRDLSYVRRHVLCLFEDQAGSIYPEWSRDKHLVKWLKPGSEAVEIWMAMDPGTTKINPTAAGWYVVDRRMARLVQIAEYQEYDLPAAKHAENWRRIEGSLPGRVTWRTGDPNTLAARDRGSNMRLTDIYRRYGFSFIPGPVSHKVRVPALGELIALSRFVVTSSCPRTFDQIEGYAWENQLPQNLDLGPYRDVVRKGNDHLVDCAQYAAARWVLRHKSMGENTEKTPEQHFADEVRRKIRKQMRPEALASGVVV